MLEFLNRLSFKTKLMGGLLIFGFVPSILFAQSFRNVKWGYTRKQVVDSEKMRPYFVSESNLTYKPVLVYERELTLSYGFLNNKLTNAQYSGNWPVKDSSTVKALFLRFVEKAIVDMGEPKVLTEDTSSTTKLAFQSGSTKATCMYGLVRPNEYALIVYYSVSK